MAAVTTERTASVRWRAVASTSMLRARLLVLLLTACALGGAGAIDDVLSYKSLVLGSLSSGQRVAGRVSRSSCHNYFMNVTDFGYNLVVDLDSRSPSSQLFLLVKASPILRHSLEDEHNYASYYQFKKQGDHHGVVVTSEHLSPGRWYIGVCNYVQEVAIFDDKRAASHHSTSPSDDAEYTVVATLNRTKEKPVRPAEAAEDGDDKSHGTETKGFENAHLDDKDASCSGPGGGLCTRNREESHQNQDSEGSSTQGARQEEPLKLRSGGSIFANNELSRDARRKRAEEEERTLVARTGSDESDDGGGEVNPETLFWAVRAEALEKELERVRLEMEIVKDELTGVLSHAGPARSPKAPLERASHLHGVGGEGEAMHVEEEYGDDPSLHESAHAMKARRRRRKLPSLPAYFITLVPDTLLPGGELCDDVGVCIGGVGVGLLFSILSVAVVLFATRERYLSRDDVKPSRGDRVKRTADSLQPSGGCVDSGSSQVSPTAPQPHKGKGKSARRRASDEVKDQGAGLEKTLLGKAASESRDAGGADESQELKRANSGCSKDVEMLERRCEELEEQIRSEHEQRSRRGSAMEPVVADPGDPTRARNRGGSFASPSAEEVQELMQALEAANARVHALETSSRRWKGDAEAAEERIARISREKAAAEKAAEVLESLLSHGTPTDFASAISAGDYVVAGGAAQVEGPAVRSGKRRPPSVNAELGMTPTHSAYSTPMALRNPLSPINTPAMAMPVVHPLTPTSSYGGMAPIGTPVTTPTQAIASQMACGSVLSSSRTPVRSLGGTMDSSMDRSAGSKSKPQDDWSTAPGTPMDGTAFAAFMGMNSSIDCSLPLEALEADSSAVLGCGNRDCGGDGSCEACERERRDSLPGGMEGMAILDGTVVDGWVSMRERDMDGAGASVGGSEESPSWPTRARGRRGGRRQKRVNGEGIPVAPNASAAGMEAGAGDEMSVKDQGDCLATSMALAAIGDE